MERLKSATGCYSGQPGTISADPWWKKSASVMAFKGRVSPSRQPLFWPQHALIILFSTISAQCGVADLVYDSLPSGVSVANEARPIIVFYPRFRDICIYI